MCRAGEICSCEHRGAHGKLKKRGYCIIHWVGPPPTKSGILGIYKDPSIITITSWSHY